MLRFSTNLPSDKKNDHVLVVGIHELKLSYYSYDDSKLIEPFIYVEGSNNAFEVTSNTGNIGLVSIHEDIVGACPICMNPVTYYNEDTYFTVDVHENNDGEECISYVNETKFTFMEISKVHQRMVRTAELGTPNRPPIFYHTSIFIDSELMEFSYYVEGGKHLTLTREDHNYINSIIIEEVEKALGGFE